MIDQLHEFCPHLRAARDDSNVEMVVHYTNSAGEAKIKGGRDLKQSQSYPLPLLCLIPTVEFWWFCFVMGNTVPLQIPFEFQKWNLPLEEHLRGITYNVYYKTFQPSHKHFLQGVFGWNVSSFRL